MKFKSMTIDSDDYYFEARVTKSVNAPNSNLPASGSLLYDPLKQPKTKEHREDELTVRSILAYQSFNGSFDHRSTDDMNTLLGGGFMTAVSNIERTSDRDKHLALTAAIIIVLELKFQSCKDLWSLVVVKARAFIDRNVQRTTCRELLQSATKHLRDVKISKRSVERSEFGGEGAPYASPYSLDNQLNVHLTEPPSSYPLPPSATPAYPPFAYPPMVNITPSNLPMPSTAQPVPHTWCSSQYPPPAQYQPSVNYDYRRRSRSLTRQASPEARSSVHSRSSDESMRELDSPRRLPRRRSRRRPGSRRELEFKPFFGASRELGSWGSWGELKLGQKLESRSESQRASLEGLPRRSSAVTQTLTQVPG